jgi:hypothetical protein
MDHSDVNPWMNKSIKIEDNMSHWITLCLEHIVIVRLHNYKFSLIHTKETHFYLNTY